MFKHYLSLLLLSVALGCTSAVAATNGEKKPWWPSEWGAEDQLGALNRIDSKKVVQAARMITKGKVYDMAHTFEEDMPLFELTPQHRKYTLTISGAPSWGPMGDNSLIWNEDYIAGHLSQDGTQFDALSHMGTALGNPSNLANIRYYNGWTHAEIATGRGFTKLGVEQVKPIFTRGVLVDIAGYKGRIMACGEEISIADLEAALRRQGLDPADILPGDALFYYTGWGSLWKTDNKQFNRCAPGLSDQAGDWVVSKKVVLVGTDNWAVEAIPGPNPKLFAPNHQKFLVENGIYIMENMDFNALLADQVYTFAFVFGAIPFKGATGSPARPFAIK